MKFLNDNVFQTPTFFIDENILRRIEADGAVTRIGQRQRSILTSLFANDKLSRLIEYEAFVAEPVSAYTVQDLIGDVHKGIWSELSAPYDVAGEASALAGGGCCALRLRRRGRRPGATRDDTPKRRRTPKPKISTGSRAGSDEPRRHRRSATGCSRR